MKQVILSLIALIFSLLLHQCRTEIDTDYEIIDHKGQLKQSRDSTNSLNDPDPPVKDGQDWKYPKP